MIVNSGAVSGYAGAKSVMWWYNRLVKKGVIPLFNQEDVEKAPALPPNHPYNSWVNKSLYISSVLIYFAGMIGLPFLFHYLQKILFQTPDMLLYYNNLAAVLSLFPSLLFSFWISYLLYLKIGEIWPDYRTTALYSTIIAANRFQQGMENKTQWEKLIKPNHLDKLNDYEEHFFRKSTLWVLLICLPIYAVLIMTYTAVTKTTITERSLGFTETHSVQQASSVNAVLTFKEEKNNGKYELRPRIKLDLLFKDGEKLNLCDFGCNSANGNLIEYVELLKKTYNVPVNVTPLKPYQKELLQKENPNMFLFYQQLDFLGR